MKKSLDKPASVSFLLLIVTLIVTYLLCTPHASFAQTTDNTIPKLSLNTSVGIGSNLPPSAASITVPPIAVSLDIKILPQVTAGPYLFYESVSYLEFGGAGVRGIYHFHIPSKVFGVYAGGILSYVYQENREAEEVYGSETNYNNSNINSIGNTSESKVGYNVFVGGEAHFSNSICAFAELGYGIAYLNLGLSFKLN